MRILDYVKLISFEDILVVILEDILVIILENILVVILRGYFSYYLLIIF